jgi:hypothetical protein
VARRRGIENDSPTDRGLAAEDHAVPSGSDHRGGKSKLREAPPRPDDAGGDMSRAEVGLEPDAVGNRLELLERDVEAVRDRIRARSDEGVAALHVSPLHAWQADRNTLP